MHVCVCLYMYVYVSWDRLQLTRMAGWTLSQGCTLHYLRVSRKG